MLLQQFQQRLKDHFHLQAHQHKFLLAVSGGIDSIVLADLVYKSGFDFVIVHCNFKLRADESTRDETFVRSLETKYGKPVLVKQFDTEKYAAENKLSIQEAARDLRYAWFADLIKHESEILNPKPEIVTAHNANDNIETMLMHFFRGTGIHGLTGIPEYDAVRNIIRPLLFAKREEILVYAKENNLQWVEDSSNVSDKYTRNFFRLQLIPAIKEAYPNAENNLLSNLERFKEAEVLYKQSVDLHKQKLVEQKGSEWHIPVLKLKKVVPLNTILWEIISEFGFNAAQLNEIKKLIDAGNGSYINSITHRIIKNRNWLVIAPLQTENAANILIEVNDKNVSFENGVLYFKTLQNSGFKLSSSNTTATLNADEIKFPLLLRKWKQGDYFYPLGMQKKKKLSKFFIDQKLSKTDKEKVWVLESDKKVLWVIGHRIDDRFKITGGTKQVLQIEFASK
ncbi:tRNA lysidine(34) synthetase TilS [soil metagenome]